MKEVGLIFFGWVMGLFGNILYDLIKKRSLRNEVRSGIRTELEDIKTKLAFNAMNVALNYGNYDRATLEWVKKHASDVKQLHTNQTILDTIDKMLEFSDKEIEYNAPNVSAIKRLSGRGIIAFKKTNLPYLTSHFGNLSLLETDVQRLLLEINAQLGFMNEEIENGKYFLRLSFDSSISPDNHKKNDLNLDDSNQQVGQIAKKVADLIEVVLPMLED